MFRRSETAHYQHGKGVYFTDSLDYCWFYGGNVDNRANKNKIPNIGDIFTAIGSMVYYKREGFLQVKGYKTRLIPGKNEINFAYAGAELETIEKPDKTKNDGFGRHFCLLNLKLLYCGAAGSKQAGCHPPAPEQ